MEIILSIIFVMIIFLVCPLIRETTLLISEILTNFLPVIFVIFTILITRYIGGWGIILGPIIVAVAASLFIFIKKITLDICNFIDNIRIKISNIPTTIKHFRNRKYFTR